MGKPAEPIAYISQSGGLVIAPAAPPFIAVQDDADYRRAIADGNLAIAAHLLVCAIVETGRTRKAYAYLWDCAFQNLARNAGCKGCELLFFVLPSEKAPAKTLAFAREFGYPISADDCYVAPKYQKSEATDRRSAHVACVINAGLAYAPKLFDLSAAPTAIADLHLVSILESRKPKRILIGIGGGKQDKLGSYLKHLLNYRPAIYCIGAAPSFVTARSGSHSNVG